MMKHGHNGNTGDGIRRASEFIGGNKQAEHRPGAPLPCGGHMNIVGAPKTCKSWTAIRLALVIAAGGSWLGMKCDECRVLLVENHLSPEELAGRMRTLAKNMGFDRDDPALDNLHIDAQEDRAQDIRQLAGRYAGKGYDVIILDSLEPMLPSGMDPESPGGAAGIRDLIGLLSRKTGAAIVTVTDTKTGAGPLSADTFIHLKNCGEKGMLDITFIGRLDGGMYAVGYTEPAERLFYGKRDR